VLDRLKRNPLTRHIPVNVISVVERNERGAALGAFAYLEKPVTKDALQGTFAHLRCFVERTIRRLLLVEDDEVERQAITHAVAEAGGVEVLAVSSAEQALAELDKQPFDCMVVDLVLPGLDGVSLIAEVKQREAYKDLPVIVYTGKDLDAQEEAKLKRFAASVVVKAGLSSLERVANDTSLFLHRVCPETPSKPLASQASERIPISPNTLLSVVGNALGGKTVLVVDDDVRNVFALSSALETAGLRVVYAMDGRAGIDALERHDAVDVVLLDVMMPNMDGYETIRAIRHDPRYARLPIIAVTAKALHEDREKCLLAGASDYIAKPVDAQVLLERIVHWTLGQTVAVGSA
jgi:CheY-like chemotaxis protein